MPGRNFSAGSEYRYGFNGKENDKDISEDGQDYGMRIYDGRLGRFLSVDPLAKLFPWYSPYHFAGCSPIRNLDLDGGEPQDYTENWQYQRINNAGTDKESNYWTRTGPDNQYGRLNLYDYAAVYDKVSDQFWFVMQDGGKYYYWKHNPGADQMRYIASNIAGNSNGQWVPFETRNAREARITNELCDATATFVAVGITVAVTAPALMEVSASQAVDFIVEEAVEEVVEQVTGIPIIINPVDVVEHGLKKVIRGQVKERLVEKYGKDVVKGPGSYTIKYADGTAYHGAGNVEEAIKRAADKSKGPDDLVSEVDWTPSPSREQQFRDEAKRLNDDGGYKNPANRNQRDSPGNRKYKKKDD